MSAAEAKVGITMDANRFRTEGKNVEQQFDQIRQKGTQSMQGIKTSTQQAGQEIQRLEQRVTQTKQRFAASFVGMTANAISFGLSIRDLGDSQIKIDQLALKIKKLDEALKSGSVSADQLGNKQEELRILQERHTNAIEDQQKAYINFGLTLLTLGTVTVPTTIAALKQMNLAQAQLAAIQTQAAAAGITQSTTNLGVAATSRVATQAAATQTTVNLGLAASFRAILLSAGPIGLIIGGASLATFAAYEAITSQTGQSVDHLGTAYAETTPKAQSFHAEVDRGRKTAFDYKSSLDQINQTLDATQNHLSKEFGFGRFVGKNTAIGSVESYSKLDSLISSASGEVKTILKFEKDTEAVIRKVVQARSDELSSLGLGNQFLERRLRLETQIEQAKERAAKREREDSKKKRGDDREESIKDRKELEKELELLNSIPLSLRPVFTLFETLKTLDPFDLAGGRQILALVDKINAKQNARFAATINQEFSQESFGLAIGGGPSSSFTTALFNGRLASFNRSNTQGRSGSQKARRGGFGGNKDPFTSLPFDLALARAIGLPISSASNAGTVALQARASAQINSILQLIQEEGFSVPTITGRQSESRVQAALASIQSLFARASQQRADRIAQQTAQAGFLGVSLSEFQALSAEDVAGRTLFVQRTQREIMSSTVI